MKMFVAGEWIPGSATQPVINPYTGKPFDEVPTGTAGDVTRAIGTLTSGAVTMRAMSAWDRSRILTRAATALKEQVEDFARTITQEMGKPIRESRTEVLRAADVFTLSAEEGRRLCGNMLPVEGTETGRGKLGFTLRVPCGIVAAITPFNFPLNLTAHKVGPAIAGGNAVLIKPASNTPLSGLKLTRLLLECGLPPEAIACVTGPGKDLGAAIGSDNRVRKISFTGSYEAGETLTRQAGVKKVTLELGGSCPVIVMDDADVELAATAIASAGYANAGQVCISAQRIITQPGIQDELLDRLAHKVKAMVPGDPLKDETTIGPLVRERDAQRVEEWIKEARSHGAEVLTGGTRDGAFIQPAIVNRVTPGMKLGCDELFGPAVAIMSASDIDEAIRLANSTRYGLSAGILTRDLNRAMQFASRVDCGSIHVNWACQWRADFMPYGGLKDSGYGKEGPKSALLEMTEEKAVILHGVLN